MRAGNGPAQGAFSHSVHPMSKIELLSKNPSPDDLIPLSRVELLGFGFGRRVIGRRIADGSFPTPVRIRGRLYITVAQRDEYKAALMRGDGHKHWAQARRNASPAAAEDAPLADGPWPE